MDAFAQINSAKKIVATHGLQIILRGDFSFAKNFLLAEPRIIFLVADGRGRAVSRKQNRFFGQRKNFSFTNRAVGRVPRLQFFDGSDVVEVPVRQQNQTRSARNNRFDVGKNFKAVRRERNCSADAVQRNSAARRILTDGKRFAPGRVAHKRQAVGFGASSAEVTTVRAARHAVEIFFGERIGYRLPQHVGRLRAR